MCARTGRHRVNSQLKIQVPFVPISFSHPSRSVGKLFSNPEFVSGHSGVWTSLLTMKRCTWKMIWEHLRDIMLSHFLVCNSRDLFPHFITRIQNSIQQIERERVGSKSQIHFSLSLNSFHIPRERWIKKNLQTSACTGTTWLDLIIIWLFGMNQNSINRILLFHAQNVSH